MATSNEDRVFLLLKTLSHNLHTLVIKLQAPPEDDSSDIEGVGGDFWKQLEDCSQLISQDATKLSLSCSQHPLPLSKDMLPITESIQNHHTFLTTITISHLRKTHNGGKTNNTTGKPHLFGKPRLFGKTLSKHIHSYVISVIQGSIDLIGSLVSPQSRNSKKHLQCTGLVWEATEDIKKLPRDNYEAVRLDLLSSLNLFSDAYDELNEAVEDSVNNKENNNGDGDDDDGDDGDDDDDDGDDDDDLLAVKWKPEELEMVKPMFGLLKTSKAVLMMIIKKLKSLSSPPSSSSSSRVEEVLGGLSLEEDQLTHQLDSLPPNSSHLTSIIDDLISSLYPPIHHSPTILNHIVQLSNTLLQCLSIFRECSRGVGDWGDGGVEKVDFMEKAVHHNKKKCSEAVEKYINNNNNT